jgi:hypothetical protein
MKLDIGVFKIKVKLEAEDQGTPDKVKSIKVRIASEFDSDSKTVSGGYFEETLTINWFSGAVLGGLDVEVTVTDLNGNQRKVSDHIDGFIDLVADGLEDLYHSVVSGDLYFALPNYPKKWQGPFGLCAACTCLGIAHYYGHTTLRADLLLENLVTVSLRSGDNDVFNGMYTDEQRAYHESIGTFEDIDSDPTFDGDIKNQLRNEFDPVHAIFEDYYGDSEIWHAVTIVGFMDNALGEYAIIQDSNVAVTTYPRLWSDLKRHLVDVIYVDDPPLVP